MSSKRRSAVPSIALLLGLAACGGTPPTDAPDEPKPDVQPEAPKPDVKPEPPDPRPDRDPRIIESLYGAPPDDWDEIRVPDELQEEVPEKPPAKPPEKKDDKAPEKKAEPSE